MDWSAAKAKEIFREVYNAKIRVTPRNTGYDFEAELENGQVYAIEAKGTDSELLDGRLQLKWHQIIGLANARTEGKVPILFVANRKGDYGVFVLQHTVINGEESFQKGELP